MPTAPIADTPLGCTFASASVVTVPKLTVADTPFIYTFISKSIVTVPKVLAASRPVTDILLLVIKLIEPNS